MEAVRLQKILSSAGLASRRAAEEYILQGRVSVNGEIIRTLGARAHPSKDQIAVDGVRIEQPQRVEVWMLNKPRRTMTTKHDPEGRRTVMEFLPKELKVNPIGRLDYHSEGLLLFTNDGELANRLMHPRYGVRKKYHVKIEGDISDSALNQLTQGVLLEDGMGRFDRATRMRGSKNITQIEVEVSEGRNRFVRRMLETTGKAVLSLKRVQQGPILLGTLKTGCARALTKDENSALQRSLVG